MAPRRVLVTGVSRYLGEALARQLSDDPSIEAVVGVDTHPPRDSLGRADFVRADIRNPLIARVISSTEVDTVVH
ncbi:MAG: NAD-dependent epimerase/dehydratase family protein, partial [Mycobacteriales bacterium]